MPFDHEPDDDGGDGWGEGGTPQTELVLVFSELSAQYAPEQVNMLQLAKMLSRAFADEVVEEYEPHDGADETQEIVFTHRRDFQSGLELYGLSTDMPFNIVKVFGFIAHVKTVADVEDVDFIFDVRGDRFYPNIEIAISPKFAMN